mgnify:CR=1 FL=1
MPHYHHEDYHQHFRSHFETALTDLGGDYPTFEPYYSFGYDYALDDDFADRTYDEAADDLRHRFAAQYPGTDYETVEEAIRFAYTYTRRNNT